ncbi:MAG: transposase [Bacillus sp. (in: Bacteria)]|nr:transposase [Bacillus sp. (in: firmicutes)]
MGKVVSKSFNDDFKRTVVELYHSGTFVKNLSSEYDVSEVSIYKWIKRFSPMNLEDESTVTPDDYAKLQKQLRRLQEENFDTCLAPFKKYISDQYYFFVPGSGSNSLKHFLMNVII